MLRSERARAPCPPRGCRKRGFYDPDMRALRGQLRASYARLLLADLEVRGRQLLELQLLQYALPCPALPTCAALPAVCLPRTMLGQGTGTPGPPLTPAAIPGQRRTTAAAWRSRPLRWRRRLAQRCSCGRAAATKQSRSFGRASARLRRCGAAAHQRPTNHCTAWQGCGRAWG